MLPQPIADYFDDCTFGGVQAVMHADWADPVVLDGKESLVLRTRPRCRRHLDYGAPSYPRYRWLRGRDKF